MTTQILKLQARLENARLRESKAYKITTLSISDEKRREKQIDTWEKRVEELESKILELGGEIDF